MKMRMRMKSKSKSKSKRISVTFPPSPLSDVDRMARSESRSRAELLREAARMYIERKRRWRRIFAFSEKVASLQKLSEADVSAEIQAYRGKLWNRLL